MRLLVRPEAQDELLAAQAWYEQRAGLGLVVVAFFHQRRGLDAWLERAGESIPETVSGRD